MIYLASPYSHSNPLVREYRFRAACVAAARLIRVGHVIFSPIAHGHSIAAYGLPTNWRFWQRHDRIHLARCDQVVVLTIEGWLESAGVQAKIRLAAELSKPVAYLGPLGHTATTLAHVAKETER